jgi:sensor histidine kinase regulating citrate/malate metabolism
MEQQQVRRLRHDMVNHIQTLLDLEGDNGRIYLQELLDSPGLNTSKRFCENEVINVVLTSKFSQMDELNIVADITVDIQENISISKLDLCSLFANSLDNAIEASVKLSEEKRKITLNAKVDKNLLLMQIINNRTNDMIICDGIIKTNKKDVRNHGYGLMGIRDIITRYEGSMEVVPSQDTFALYISIPIIK